MIFKKQSKKEEVKEENNDSLIKVRNLVKVYGSGKTSFKALKGLNLDIKKGESVAIVGKSGSGKSTLMHLLALLDTPTSGTIEINSKSTTDISKRQLNKLRNNEFGFIFQQFFMNASDTVLSNVKLPLSIGNTSRLKRTQKALEALKSVGLEEKSRNKAANLSGGQKQRVCIARAIVNNPNVIFADEPTGNLDSETGAMIERLMFDLHKKRGITLIIVTHDPDLAALCDRQIAIKDGEIIAQTSKNDETPETIFDQLESAHANDDISSSEKTITDQTSQESIEQTNEESIEQTSENTAESKENEKEKETSDTESSETVANIEQNNEMDPATTDTNFGQNDTPSLAQNDAENDIVENAKNDIDAVQQNIIVENTQNETQVNLVDTDNSKQNDEEELFADFNDNFEQEIAKEPEVNTEENSPENLEMDSATSAQNDALDIVQNDTQNDQVENVPNDAAEQIDSAVNQPNDKLPIENTGLRIPTRMTVKLFNHDIEETVEQNIEQKTHTSHISHVADEDEIIASDLNEKPEDFSDLNLQLEQNQIHGKHIDNDENFEESFNTDFATTDTNFGQNDVIVTAENDEKATEENEVDLFADFNDSSEQEIAKEPEVNTVEESKWPTPVAENQKDSTLETETLEWPTPVDKSLEESTDSTKNADTLEWPTPVADNQKDSTLEKETLNWPTPVAPVAPVASVAPIEKPIELSTLKQENPENPEKPAYKKPPLPGVKIHDLFSSPLITPSTSEINNETTNNASKDSKTSNADDAPKS